MGTVSMVVDFTMSIPQKPLDKWFVYPKRNTYIDEDKNPHKRYVPN